MVLSSSTFQVRVDDKVALAKGKSETVGLGCKGAEVSGSPLPLDLPALLMARCIVLKVTES